MCVAVIVESKYNIRKKDLLAMEGDNPDGAGVAWIEGGVVKFQRGLTAAAIFELQKTLPRPFFLHFRFATRGGKSPLLTHPFPLGMDTFTAGLSGDTDQGVLMHNGTWRDFEKYIPQGIDRSKVSDTQVAAYALTTEGHDILDDVSWATAILFRDDNKWKINYRGTWTTHKGNLYSNLHWRTRSRKTSYDYKPFVGYKPYTGSKAYESWWNKPVNERVSTYSSYEEWNKKQAAKHDAAHTYKRDNTPVLGTEFQDLYKAQGSKIPAPDSPTGSNDNWSHKKWLEEEDMWAKLAELEEDTIITMSVEEALELESDGVPTAADSAWDAAYARRNDWLNPDQEEIEASLQRAWRDGGGEG